MGAAQQVMASLGGLAAPVNSVAPVRSGVQIVGVAHTVTTGTWSGSPTFSYQWKRNGTTNIGTNSAAYTTVTADVGSTISCVVTATNAAGSATATSGSSSAILTTGEVTYNTPGTFSWTCPANVFSVSGVVVGISPNSGAPLAYKNNYAVTPGNTYTIVIDSGTGVRSSFVNDATLSAGGSFSGRTGDGGGDGGNGNGGGAGGYSGNGGRSGAATGGASEAGAGGGGSGGGYDNGSGSTIGAGGGVGLYGQGASGASVPATAIGTAGGGKGGSGGTNAQPTSTGYALGAAGNYGGGPAWDGPTGTSGASALRLIWPGNLRTFPSTNTGAL